MHSKANIAFVLALFFVTIVQCRNVDIDNNDIDDSGDDDAAYYQGVPLYAVSRDCAMLGGVCVLRGDCEPGNQTFMKGLCPDKDIGVECCYRVTPRPSTCAQQQGECMDECSTEVQRGIATDCPAYQKCCVLV